GDLRDLLRRPREEHQVGRVPLTESIGGIRRSRGGVIADELGADSRGDRLTKGCGHDQCDAPAPDGCSDSTKRSMRVAPSRSRSSAVAYEIRMYPGAANASPGTTTTFSLSTSAWANSADVRMPSGDNSRVMSGSR